MDTANTHTHSLTYTDTRLHIHPPAHTHNHTHTHPRFAEKEGKVGFDRHTFSKKYKIKDYINRKKRIEKKTFIALHTLDIRIHS